MSSSRLDRYVSLVRDFSARVVVFHETVAQRLGVHGTDLKALRLLGAEAMTAGRLAEEMALTGAAVTALVDRLETAGYLTRERDPDDRRRVTIRAAPTKLRKLDQLYAGQNAAMAKLLAKYSADEFAAIADYLASATQILDEQTARLRAPAASEK